jgi:nucleoside-diphosphate-sugar epimerase
MCDTDLQSSFNNNVRNFVNLTNKLTTQKFIYASSASVYGNTSDTNIAEDNVNFSPINYYDMTKLHIDHIMHLSPLDYYGLRFGTVNGPAPSIRTDVMINAMVNTAMQKGEIHVFNADTRRSILGINDLCRAVETIIDDNKKSNRGVYNTASFTNTAGEIAEAVGKHANVPVIDKDPPSVVFNEKLQNKTYDFGISTTKFENTFNFKFTDTLDSITQEMVKHYAKCNKGHRAEVIHYT